MEICNSEFKYIHLSNLCSNSEGNCTYRLPVKWPKCYWNKTPFKWFCLDGRIPMSKIFKWGGTIPSHQFCFLIDSCICNWCTAIQYHSKENIIHTDPTLRLLSLCHPITHHVRETHWLGLLGRIHYNWSWVSTGIILMSAHFDMCSSMNSLRHKMSLPVPSLSLQTKPSLFNPLPSGVTFTLVAFVVKNYMVKN